MFQTLIDSSPQIIFIASGIMLAVTLAILYIIEDIEGNDEQNSSSNKHNH